MEDAPQENRTYDVVIGETVTGGSEDHYHVLQYGFKPASIDRNQDGVLKKTENGGIEVEFANTSGKGTGDKVYFKGQYAPCKEYECILIFDGSSGKFRLERLMGQGKGLKVVRKDQTKQTGKLEIPPDLQEPPEGGGRPRSTARPKPEAITTGHAANGTVAPTGSSPDGDDGATPATKRPRTTRKASSTTQDRKRPRKQSAKGAKENSEAAAPAEDTEDLLALVDQIESGVPEYPRPNMNRISVNIRDSIRSQSSQEAADDDFLIKAFTEDTPAEAPADSFITPSRPSNPVKPPSSSFPSNQPHQFPPIQQPNFSFPSSQRNGQAGHTNGAPLPVNGLPNGAAPKEGDSSSGSESESASESESESESASESSSESESENE